MNNSVVPTKCRALYQAFAAMQQQGTLNSLADAEKMLQSFGANVESKNTIEFDFLLGGRVYEERLYEYSVPLQSGIHATFYVDKHLGFECGDNLPDSYKQVIKGLHVKFDGQPQQGESEQNQHQGDVGHRPLSQLH